MFSGIVEEKGRVEMREERERSWRYTLAVSKVAQDTQVGDSIAVNGCCLTVVEVGERQLSFDVLEETRRLTNLRDLDVGASVNLERSLRFDGRVGGHFVTGHVDGLGVVRTLRAEGKDTLFQIEIPKGFERYVVYKGCIAIDGMSLTVAQVEERLVSLWLIPHTLQATNVGERGVGDRVNLEFDLLAKYTERIVGASRR